LAGTITLGGNYTVRDGITLAMDSDTDARTLTITSNSFVLAGSIGISVGSGDTLNISSTLADDGTVTSTLIKTGSGLVVLSGTNNTATGGTTGTGLNDIQVQAGTLRIASDAHLGTGQVRLEGSSTLAVTATTTIDNEIFIGTGSVNGTASVSVASATTTYLDGGLAGAGSLQTTGTGTLSLSSSSNATAVELKVTSGTLSLGYPNDFGSQHNITLNGGTLALGAGTSQAAIAVTNASTISTSGNTTLSGVISGSAALTKTGSGTLTLSGTNPHSGNWTISAGTLTASDGSAIGDASTVTIAGGASLKLSTSETIGSLSSGASKIGRAHV
jgi:autotransporter-associated beta strand protein